MMPFGNIEMQPTAAAMQDNGYGNFDFSLLPLPSFLPLARMCAKWPDEGVSSPTQIRSEAFRCHTSSENTSGPR